MKKFLKKIAAAVLAVGIAFSFTSCDWLNGKAEEGKNAIEQKIAEWKKKFQDALDSTPIGQFVDVETMGLKIPDELKGKITEIVIDKAVGLTGLDLEDATLIVQAAGVVIERVSGGSINISSLVGDGDIGIKDCVDIINLIVNGGGSNSIHIEGTCDITNISVAKEGVSLKVESTSGIQTINIVADNVTITGTSDSTTKIPNVIISGDVDVVAFNNVNVESVTGSTAEVKVDEVNIIQDETSKLPENVSSKEIEYVFLSYKDEEPYKTEYFIGDKFDYTGLYVQVVYKSDSPTVSGDSEIIPLTSGAKYDFSTMGNKTVTFTYLGKVVGSENGAEEINVTVYDKNNRLFWRQIPVAEYLDSEDLYFMYAPDGALLITSDIPAPVTADDIIIEATFTPWPEEYDEDVANSTTVKAKMGSVVDVNKGVASSMYVFAGYTTTEDELLTEIYVRIPCDFAEDEVYYSWYKLNKLTTKTNTEVYYGESTDGPDEFANGIPEKLPANCTKVDEVIEFYLN